MKRKAQAGPTQPKLSRNAQDLLRLIQAGQSPIAPGELEVALAIPRSTLNRELSGLLARNLIEREGQGRSTRYVLTQTAGATADADQVKSPEAPPTSAVPSPLRWSKPAVELLDQLNAPLGARAPVGYDQRFVDSYVPNESSLLPPLLASDLYAAGRGKDQQPAGTYAREVLQQLLIDLSWSSSHLEGNAKTMLDTKELFQRSEQAEVLDQDTIMLLNHKSAIEFMVDAVPTEGITLPVVVDVQAKLMRDLLSDSRDIGSIRRRVVSIDGSVYNPSNIPSVLEGTLKTIVEKVRLIRNPVEAAFFMWVNLAYLQPFADGNKRTSRLCANMPLMLYNCAPLSFLDVQRTDYMMAMLGVYEQRNVVIATDLFEYTYRRSIEKYSVLRASMDVPDPLRARYRQAMNEIMQLVVIHGIELQAAMPQVSLVPIDVKPLLAIIESELDHLEVYNCARYNLTRSMTQKWIDDGRRR